MLAKSVKVSTIALLSASAIAVTINQPSQAVSTDFFCGTNKGTPTTFARTSDGKKLPIIRWTSQLSGLSPQQRCQAVSRKFQKNFDNGTLITIISGTINKQPVICAAASTNDVCTESTVLFTLKPGSNPRKVIQSLFDRRALASGEIQNQSSDDSHIAIDFDAYLSGLTAER
jgi:Circadian oscillating protein COP23